MAPPETKTTLEELLVVGLERRFVGLAEIIDELEPCDDERHDFSHDLHLALSLVRREDQIRSLWVAPAGHPNIHNQRCKITE